MKKHTTLYLLLFTVILFFSSLTFKAQNNNKQEPKKQKIDTVKKDKVLLDVIVVDTIATYKGKFIPFKRKVHASYYAEKFNGKRTASGKKYNSSKLTAAHKKLPFGTKVRVTNESNGKSVIVEITDRGPFVRGREIDLSRKAFMSIVGNKNSGMAIVTIEVLQ
jgi:rare lipoprotein A